MSEGRCITLKCYHSLWRAPQLKLSCLAVLTRGKYSARGQVVCAFDSVLGEDVARIVTSRPFGHSFADSRVYPENEHDEWLIPGYSSIMHKG